MDSSHQAPPPDEALREYYHLHFAGRPRITRNTVLLGQLVALAKNNHNITLATLWGKELKLIEQEQAGAGEAGRQIALRVEDAHFVLQRLRLLQQDAGRIDAAALDVCAVGAVLQDCEIMAATLGPLAQAGHKHSPRAKSMHEALVGAQHHYQGLAEAARAQRTSGPELSRAQAAVRAAQLLQHTFDTRIAHHPGNIVRPERLLALAEGLQDAAQDLANSGLAGADHEANCQALQQQAAQWRAQAQKAAALRRQNTPDELAHSLAQASDDILEAAHTWPAPGAAQNERLAAGIALCDRMDEVRRQLEGVPLVFGLAEHHHTLSTVTDALAYLLERLDEQPPTGQPS